MNKTLAQRFNVASGERLVTLFKDEQDQGSRATVTIILGLIKWNQKLSRRVENVIMEIFRSSSSLLRLASAYAMCLRQNPMGLPVLLGELMKGDNAFDPASLREVAGFFSEEQILSEMIPFVNQPDVNLSVLLEVERGCTYYFSSENEEVHSLIFQGLTDGNPRIREYMVKRASYCLENETVKAVLMSTAEHDPDLDVRAAAVEVLGGYEWANVSQTQKADFCNLLASVLSSAMEPAKVRQAAAAALSVIIDEENRIKKLRAVLNS